jgi:hypothetical protein
MATSYHGLLNQLKSLGIVADSVAIVHSVLVKCVYVVNGS